MKAKAKVKRSMKTNISGEDHAYGNVLARESQIFVKEACNINILNESLKFKSIFLWAWEDKSEDMKI